MEKETTGLYLTGHPMDEYRETARRYHAAPIGAILSDFAQEEDGADFQDGQKVTIAGVITSAKTKTTRNNSLMAYVTLEDDTGSMELLVFSRVLGESGSYLKENMPVLAAGGISVRGEKAPQLMVDSVRPLLQDGAAPDEAAEPAGKKRQKLFVRLPSAHDPRWRKIQLILELFPGNEPFKAKFMDTEQWAPASPCVVHPSLVRELREMLGEENVVVQEKTDRRQA